LRTALFFWENSRLDHADPTYRASPLRDVGLTAEANRTISSIAWPCAAGPMPPWLTGGKRARWAP